MTFSIVGAGWGPWKGQDTTSPSESLSSLSAYPLFMTGNTEPITNPKFSCYYEAVYNPIYPHSFFYFRHLEPKFQNNVFDMKWRMTVVQIIWLNLEYGKELRRLAFWCALADVLVCFSKNSLCSCLNYIPHHFICFYFTPMLNAPHPHHTIH